MRAEAQRVARVDKDATPRDQAGIARLPVPATASSRTRLRLLALLIAGWALVYLIAYVPARGNGSDFQVFYAGAVADAHGQNPFDWPQLWRTEQSLYNGGAGHGTLFAFAPYADPPPFALALRPFTALAEGDAYRLWAALLLVCGACGAYLCLVGWPRMTRVCASALVAISPAALFDVRLGQNSTPLLLSLGLAVSLTAGGLPFFAGAALGLGLLKPHLMVPVAAIFILAAPRGTRRAVTAGLMVTAALEAGAGIVLDGGIGAYRHWLGSVRGFGDSIRHQPDLASVPGLYLGQAAPLVSGLLNLLCLGLAAVIVWRLAVSARAGGMPERARLLGGGTAAYLALSPYVHTSDQVLLALPLLLLIRPDGSGLRDNAVLLAAVATIVAPMVVLRDYHTVGINALPPLCIGLAYWLGAPRREQIPATARGMIAHD